MDEYIRTSVFVKERQLASKMPALLGEILQGKQVFSGEYALSQSYFLSATYHDGRPLRIDAIGRSETANSHGDWLKILRKSCEWQRKPCPPIPRLVTSNEQK